MARAWGDQDTYFKLFPSECLFNLCHIRAFPGPLVKGQVLVDAD
jgi:hypothetical protein